MSFAFSVSTRVDALLGTFVSQFRVPAGSFRMLLGSLADRTLQIRFRPPHAQGRRVRAGTIPPYNAIIVEVLNSVEERDWGSSINLAKSVVKVSR